MLLPETLKEHNQEQFEFHYIYFLPWKNQMVEAIEKAGGKVTCFSAKNNVQLLLKFPKIIKYCKKHKIQLIHAHLPWAGFVSRIVFNISKTPTLYTEHNLQERYHFLTKWINKFTFNSQSLAIGVSEDVTNSIKKNINPKINCQTILNGVNTKNFYRNLREEYSEIRKEYNIPNEAFVIGTVAVFRFQKRLDLWLEVLKKAVEINPKIYGIIVGAGPLEEELFAKHKELNLEGRVFFTGLQTEVKPYFQAIDVFMMTSSFEGLPIALLESMSMGCAVISTNAGGVKEVIRNEEDGVLVDVKDWESLSSILLELSEDKERIEYYQQQARKRVKDRFSIEKMVQDLEKLYKKYAK